MRIRISRKEAKESVYWLGLIDVGGCTHLDSERQTLHIFGAILKKTQ